MLKTIIVALDCTDTSDLLMRALNNLQIQPETKVILTHVISNRIEDEEKPDRPRQSQEAIYQSLEKQLHLYQSKSFNSELALVNGDPAEEILRIANIHRADLIVIGTRGITGVQRILSASVGSQVVADASCSVLVVKG